MIPMQQKVIVVIDSDGDTEDGSNTANVCDKGDGVNAAIDGDKVDTVGSNNATDSNNGYVVESESDIAVEDETEERPRDESRSECLFCNELAIQKLYLEEKLALVQVAYNDTRSNLESSDKKLAENETKIDDLRDVRQNFEISEKKLAENVIIIDDLKDVIERMKAEDPTSKLAEKDLEIRRVKIS